jgi:hypothetical protein
VEPDPGVPSGYVSIAFAYGSDKESGEDVERTGTNPNALINCDSVFDRYTGQPRMSNIPVDVSN